MKTPIFGAPPDASHPPVPVDDLPLHGKRHVAPGWVVEQAVEVGAQRLGVTDDEGGAVACFAFEGRARKAQRVVEPRRHLWSSGGCVCTQTFLGGMGNGAKCESTWRCAVTM